MAKKIIAGNWKQNGTLKSSISLTKSITSAVQKNQYSADIIIFPPSVYLSEVNELLGKKRVQIGSQNVSEFNNGAYTGEISSSMLEDLKIKYCLVGHSERRHVLNEDEITLSNKVTRLYEKNIKIIYCIGETLNQYKNKKTKIILRNQIKHLFKVNGNRIKNSPNNLIIAYEPVWAIGSGLVPTQEELTLIFDYIRETINQFNKKYSSIKILYGGSVTPDNASTLMTTQYMDGLLVGGASLMPKKFIDICSTI